jgi:hypothetical protein
LAGRTAVQGPVFIVMCLLPYLLPPKKFCMPLIMEYMLSRRERRMDTVSAHQFKCRLDQIIWIKVANFAAQFTKIAPLFIT